MSRTNMAIESESRSHVPEELETLFREQSRLVLQTAFRITGSRTDAEDVLQILFLRLLDRKDGLELKSSPAQYFRRAAVNIALDHLRKRKRQVSLEDVSNLSAARSSEPEDRQLSSELAARLRSALAHLHPTAAEMFVLRHFEGFSNTEIARLLGTSWGTVAVTLHRAHRRLRKELGSFVGGRS